jgi:hypothetical protein
MRTFKAMVSLLGVLLLAACGGGALSTVPPAVADGGRGLDGSTIAFEKDKLWAAFSEGGAIYEFPVNGSGALTPLAMLYAGLDSMVNPLQFQDVAVAPDGTVYALLNPVIANASSMWHLHVYSPGALELEHVVQSTGRAYAVALGGDGILVEVSVPGVATPVIKTYQYGVSDRAPIRKFHTPPAHSFGFVVSRDHLIYLPRPDGYDAYPITSTDGCCPAERITITRPATAGTPGSFAVGPDNSIYEAELYPPPRSTPNQGTMYVNVYPPHSGTPARRIGPLPTYVSGFSRAPVITVDGNSRLYVATAGTIYRFGTRANGASTPQRTITPPVGGYPVGLAVGP